LVSTRLPLTATATAACAASAIAMLFMAANAPGAVAYTVRLKVVAVDKQLHGSIIPPLIAGRGLEGGHRCSVLKSCDLIAQRT
jgi:hypothetical protein